MTYKVVQTKYPDSRSGKINCNMELVRATDINQIYGALEDLVGRWLDYEFVVREVEE